MSKGAETRRIMRLIRKDDAAGIELLHTAGMLDPNAVLMERSLLGHAAVHGAVGVARVLLRLGAKASAEVVVRDAARGPSPEVFLALWEAACEGEDEFLRAGLVEEAVGRLALGNAAAVLVKYPTLSLRGSRVFGNMVHSSKFLPAGSDVRGVVRRVLGWISERDPSFDVNAFRVPPQYLLDSGANADDWRSPAFFACLQRDVPVELVMEVVAWGADPLGVDARGESALMVAVRRGAVGIAEFLRGVGAVGGSVGGR